MRRLLVTASLFFVLIDPAVSPAQGPLLARDLPAGSVVVRDDDSEFQLASATLANGVRLQTRSLPGKDGTAFVSVVMPGGRLRETPANRGINEAAAQVFSNPSSARVPGAAIQKFLSGKTVRLSGEGEEDALTFRIQSSLAHLEDGLRLAHLLLTEGRLEEDAFRRWKEQAKARARGRTGDLQQVLELATTSAVMEDDARLVPASADELDRLTLPAVTAWLDAHLKEAPLEVTLVGALPRDDLVALGMKYFGSVPRRRLQDSQLPALRQVAQRKGPREERREVRAATGPSARVRVAWRLPPDLDARSERVLALARYILPARLGAELVEKRHVVTSASNLDFALFQSRAWPGNRYIAVTLEVDPARVEEAAGAARTVVEALARSGPSPTELAAARDKLASETETLYGSGEHWAGLLEGFDFRQEKRAELKKALREPATYSRKDSPGRAASPRHGTQPRAGSGHAHELRSDRSDTTSSGPSG